jgi:serine/threonine-protein kinase
MNLTDIPGYERFAKVLPLNKGWSSDKKFFIETHDGDKLLLRISGIDTYAAKKEEFENMKRVDALGIPMSQPQGFGVCNDGQSVYTLLSWIEGEDAEQILPLLPETEQYVLGLQAGEILRKMQTVETLPPSSDWFNGYGIKLDRYLNNYKNCGMTFKGDEAVIAYI